MKDDDSPWHTEVEGPSFIKQNVQERLETLTTKRVEMKLWENKDKKGSFFLPMTTEYLLDFLSNILSSKGSKRDSGPNPFWTMKGKP
jgi:hypothetical protein